MSTFLLIYCILGAVYLTLDAFLLKHFQKKKWLAGREELAKTIAMVPDEMRPLILGVATFIAVPVSFAIWPYGLVQGTLKALRHK